MRGARGLRGWAVAAGVFLAGLMSVDDGLYHCQSMMGLMELGTAAGRKEIWSARAIRQTWAASGGC